MPAKIATVRNLGWWPVLDDLDTLRAATSIISAKVDDNGAIKVIFNKLQAQFSNNDIETFRYLFNFKDILTHMGMEHVFATDATINVFTFKESVISPGSQLPMKSVSYVCL